MVSSVAAHQGLANRSGFSWHFSSYDTGVIENIVSTDSQMVMNRQMDGCDAEGNAHTMAGGRSAITN
jgi:hypothetical protein